MLPATDLLLCESCGYPIGGLPDDGACPECGRLIGTSLPSARPGSPWQQRAGLRSLVATNLMALRRPRELFSTIRVEWRRGTGLLVLHLVGAAMVIVGPWSGTLIGDPVRTARLSHDQPWTTAAVIIPLQVLLVAGVLLVLTLIEWLGIQFWARNRGHRLLPAAAWQVCTHASVGWLMAAGFSVVGMIAWLNLSSFNLTGGVSRAAAADWLLLAVPGFGALVGLLIFEYLVYVGVRQCRYANPPTAATAGA